MRAFPYIVVFFMVAIPVVSIGINLHEQGYNPTTITGIPEVEERLVSHDKGMQTEYYVIIDDEVFVVANNYRYGAYDNFSRIKTLKEFEKAQKPVTVLVVGHGKAMFYNYRNIVELK